MSRQLKFRAWDKTRNNWLHRTARAISLIGETVLFGEVLRREDDTAVRLTELNEIEWEQFTGLLDKNGKEIYEGDIVKVGDHYDGEWVQHDVHKIEWCSDEGYPAFELSPTPDHGMNGLAYIFQSGEQDIMVIGNIHENPELLEKADESTN